MEITLRTEYGVGDRVSFPCGGGREVGVIRRVVIAHADLSDNPERIVSDSVNYAVVDMRGNVHCMHEHQLSRRHEGKAL